MRPWQATLWRSLEQGAGSCAWQGAIPAGFCLGDARACGCRACPECRAACRLRLRRRRGARGLTLRVMPRCCARPLATLYRDKRQATANPRRTHAMSATRVLLSACHQVFLPCLQGRLVASCVSVCCGTTARPGGCCGCCVCAEQSDASCLCVVSGSRGCGLALLSSDALVSTKHSQQAAGPCTSYQKGINEQFQVRICNTREQADFSLFSTCKLPLPRAAAAVPLCTSGQLAA